MCVAEHSIGSRTHLQVEHKYVLDQTRSSQFCFCMLCNYYRIILLKRLYVYEPLLRSVLRFASKPRLRIFSEMFKSLTSIARIDREE